MKKDAELSKEKIQEMIAAAERDNLARMRAEAVGSSESENADRKYISQLYLEYISKIDSTKNTKKNRETIKGEIGIVFEAFLLLLQRDTVSIEKGEVAARALGLSEKESFLSPLLRRLASTKKPNKKLEKAIAITGLTEFKIGDQIAKTIIKETIENRFLQLSTEFSTTEKEIDKKKLELFIKKINWYVDLLTKEMQDNKDDKLSMIIENIKEKLAKIEEKGILSEEDEKEINKLLFGKSDND